MNEKNLVQIITPVIESLGFQCWGIEWFSQGSREVLRVYIEREAGGVKIDDCAMVSRHLSGVLDVEAELLGRYVLEVSTPGLDRPLFNAGHYARCIGKLVTITLTAKRDGQRRFTGRLQEANDEQVTLLVDEAAVTFSIGEIAKGHLVYENDSDTRG